MKAMVNIIGAGLAGLSAAVTLAKAGIGCRLFSRQSSERAQSVMAEGGINAALDTMGEGDTTAEHFSDTMKGGVYLADPNAVRGLTEGAPDIVREFVRLGVPFQMKGETLVLRNFGGQKKKRTAYAKSSTGKMLMSALIDECRKYEARGLVMRFPHHDFLSLVTEGGAVTGCAIGDTFTGDRLVFSGPVILSAGGPAGLFSGHTTGTTQNTGDAAAIAFFHGVRFANLEFIQYHPTTVGISGKRMLISEAARGEGGRLFIERNGRPWYFMEEKYPELKNLMPRDVVSREIYAVCRDPECGGQAYLDMTHLSDDTWRGKLSDLREECIHFLGIDPAAEHLPVEPGIHYFMGGIWVDERHRTNIKNLLAAGECACQYHGANRLGGNSLLGAVYGGKTAAETLSRDILSAPGYMEGFEHAPAGEPTVLSGNERDPAFERRLTDILMEGLGIVRSEEGMRLCIERIEALLKEDGMSDRMKARASLGLAMAKSAIMRRESRGSHFRRDCPERDDENYKKTSTAVCIDGRVITEYLDIPPLRETV